MSTAVTGAGLLPLEMPVTRRVRAYVAPVDRASGTPTIFDAARDGGFAVGAPPAPWRDLGWCSALVRKADAGVKALSTGAPATAQTQTRGAVGATVEVLFTSWGKLQMAVCSGSEQMNLLMTAPGAAGNGSGGAAIAATALQAGSTAESLVVGAAGAASFAVGDLLVVDVDYAGQTGYVGSGAAGAYVRAAGDVGGDLDYVRRVSLNVARVTASAGGVLTLDAPLPAGVPTAGMRMSRVVGFCDREGGRFFQEWSALFCLDGAQGDRVLFHYPRLQAMRGSAETLEVLPGGLEQMRLPGAFRALPVTDAVDGARVVCFRSYLPMVGT